MSFLKSLPPDAVCMKLFQLIPASKRLHDE
jgi:hypothetical protein